MSVFKTSDDAKSYLKELKNNRKDLLDILSKSYKYINDWNKEEDSQNN